MTRRHIDVLVVGAGVSGLTTAVCLAEAGLTVTVHAAQPPQDTTSGAAGAIWGPHLVGRDPRVARWAAVTLARLRQLAGDPATGIRVIRGTAATRAAEQNPPAWTEGIGRRARCPPPLLPGGFAAGWRFRAPVVSMPAYLGYLQGRFRAAGGRLVHGVAYPSLAAAAGSGAPVTVNCSGIGAHALVPDQSVQPVRGQVVLAANPGLTEFFVGTGRQPGDLAYLFPHQGTVLLGGTEQHGDWSLEPDPVTAARILRDCRAIEPRLNGAAVLAHKVGLRPARPQVRLEAQDTGDGRLVAHNYGHGGAGVTLSWGCALELTERIKRWRS